MSLDLAEEGRRGDHEKSLELYGNMTIVGGTDGTKVR
jgi:hypothetical protein